MDRPAQAKARHDLQSWIEADLGPGQEYSDYIKWVCPFHEDKDPSFTVWPDHFYCFGCAANGTIIDWVMRRRGLSIGAALDYLLADSTASPQALRREAKKHKRIGQQLIVRGKWHLEYAEALLRRADAIEYLEARGVPEAVAMHFGLGYRHKSPWGPAISIPWTVGEELRGIQYRVIGGTGNDRYRWDERSHGTPTVYNADAIPTSGKPLWIVEGAIKALVLITRGLDSVALVNKQGWKAGWSTHFRERPVFVCLDPDATDQSREMATEIGGNARVVYLPRKPDDLMVEYGWSAEAMAAFARQGVVA